MKISIITINYNDQEGLLKTIESVVSQTYNDIEYIVIDGGSTDGSKEVIEKYESKIAYWISEPDQGIYNAMNKGIRKASGEYLLFLNSGDVLFSTTVLEENQEHIQSEDLICFDMLCTGDTTRINKYPEKINYATFLKDTIGHQSTFIKRHLFEQYGFYDENLKIVSDWKFFFVVVVKHNVSYKKINSILSKFDMSGISSTNSKLLNDERQIVIKEYFTDHQKLYDLENAFNTLKKSRIYRVINYLGFFKFTNTIK